MRSPRTAAQRSTAGLPRYADTRDRIDLLSGRYDEGSGERVRHRRFHRRRPHLGARFYARENVLERLDSYQRDLEQELADVTELLRRLRADEAAPEGSAEPQAI